MFAAMKEALGTSRLEGTGQGGGGCINEGEVFLTDHGKVFVKRNGKEKAREMFDGEMAGLGALAASSTVRVPRPRVVLDNPAGGAVLVMEYLDMRGLSSHQATLGTHLARLHLHNPNLLQDSEAGASQVGSGEARGKVGGSVEVVRQFGFHVPTCCGYLAQNNTWCDDWVEFYSRKLQEQLTMIEKEYGDREAGELWSHLQLKIPQFFSGVLVRPSLLHGDLWSGNAAQNDTGPVIFDPACFYGHHEYDLGIAGMFGGFGKKFWDNYHALIPKDKGFAARHKLYKLFHNLNHWNHFGSGYRSGSISLMRELCN